ncbi:MAG: T9SS type A sorting domain-containing protein [Bacteroidota bacterium]
MLKSTFSGTLPNLSALFLSKLKTLSFALLITLFLAALNAALAQTAPVPANFGNVERTFNLNGAAIQVRSNGYVGYASNLTDYPFAPNRTISAGMTGQCTHLVNLAYDLGFGINLYVQGKNAIDYWLHPTRNGTTLDAYQNGVTTERPRFADITVWSSDDGLGHVNLVMTTTDVTATAKTVVTANQNFNCTPEEAWHSTNMSYNTSTGAWTIAGGTGVGHLTCLGWLRNPNFEQNRQSLSVTYPTGGVSLASGTSLTTTWNSSKYNGIATFSVVKIQLSTNGGSSWTVITPSTPNTGSYTFTLPAGVASSNCIIKISNPNKISTVAQSNSFTLTNYICAAPKSLSTTVSGSNANLYFANVPGGATSFTLKYKLSTTTAYTTKTFISSTGSTVLNGLSPGTYNWQLSGNCISGPTTYSVGPNFTIAATAGCPATSGLYSLPCPGSVYRTWRWSLNSGTATTGYQVQFQLAGNSTIYTLGTYGSNITGVNVSFGYGQVVSFRVITQCNGVSATPSAWCQVIYNGQRLGAFDTSNARWAELYPNIELSKPENIAALAEKELPTKLVIFPNPALESISIEGHEVEIPLRVYNTVGQKVMEVFADKNGQINISSLPKGSYRVVSGNSAAQFIKQ